MSSLIDSSANFLFGGPSVLHHSVRDEQTGNHAISVHICSEDEYSALDVRSIQRGETEPIREGHLCAVCVCGPSDAVEIVSRNRPNDGRQLD